MSKNTLIPGTAVAEILGSNMNHGYAESFRDIVRILARFGKDVPGIVCYDGAEYGKPGIILSLEKVPPETTERLLGTLNAFGVHKAESEPYALGSLDENASFDLGSFGSVQQFFQGAIKAHRGRLEEAAKKPADRLEEFNRFAKSAGFGMESVGV